jgi:hypothetical protein
LSPFRWESASNEALLVWQGIEAWKRWGPPNRGPESEGVSRSGGWPRIGLSGSQVPEIRLPDSDSLGAAQVGPTDLYTPD